MPKFEASWYPSFELERIMTPESDPANVNRTFTKLQLFPHNGSHVESQYHFDPHGEQIEPVALERLIGPACVADLSHKQDLEPVTGDDLQEAIGGVYQAGQRVLIRTDHPLRHLGCRDYWDTAPYLTPSAAEWIVDSRVALVGLDCVTEKPNDYQGFIIHRTILSSRIPLLENIANLHQVTQPVVWLFAAPIKVENVEAAPVRAVVVEGLLPTQPD